MREEVIAREAAHGDEVCDQALPVAVGERPSKPVTDRKDTEQLVIRRVRTSKRGSFAVVTAATWLVSRSCTSIRSGIRSNICARIRNDVRGGIRSGLRSGTCAIIRNNRCAGIHAGINGVARRLAVHVISCGRRSLKMLARIRSGSTTATCAGAWVPHRLHSEQIDVVRRRHEGEKHEVCVVAEEAMRPLRVVPNYLHNFVLALAGIAVARNHDGDAPEHRQCCIRLGPSAEPGI
mmetsp:Transcript_55455/g.154555  ORF Transcript_55455/g.154555 Transcript_55455/m.154555 type:complete len:235 (+) Transcript_55455:1682-2386(+)